MPYQFNEQTCAEHLSGVVQFATLSNAQEALMDFEPFFQMHEYLEKAYPNVHATLTKEVIGKAALLYHWKGTGKSSAKPLLFMAHQDVVPEGDHSKWTYPPYSGAIAEGCVWGRGSSDCKTNIITQLEAIEHLISVGYQPDFDIYLAYGYNEEVSGGDAPSAAKLIADTLLARRVQVGYALDEGGGMRDGRSQGYDVDLCAISVGEKGYADFEITRLDPGGHSAWPHKDGALDYVARAILAIRDNQLPYRLTEAMRKRYAALLPFIRESDPRLAELLSDMDANWDELVKVIDADDKMRPMFQTTMVPTMAQGSMQANILPEKASVLVNCRLLEGDTLESVQKHIESIIPEGMTVTLLKGNNPSPCSSIDTELAELICTICLERYGDRVILLPDVTLGGTDAKFMYEVCEHVYRFGVVYRKNGKSNAHAVNENVEIKSLAEGPEFYVELIKRYGK